MKGKDRTESTEGCNWDEVEKWKHHRIRIEIPTGVSGAGGRGRTEGGGVVGVLVTGDTRAVAPLDTKSPSDCWHGWHGTQSHWTDTRTNGEQKLNFNVRHSHRILSPMSLGPGDLHSETSQVIRLSETGLGFCRAGSGVTENLERGSPPPSPPRRLSSHVHTCPAGIPLHFQTVHSLSVALKSGVSKEMHSYPGCEWSHNTGTQWGLWSLCRAARLYCCFWKRHKDWFNVYECHGFVLFIPYLFICRIWLASQRNLTLSAAQDWQE